MNSASFAPQQYVQRSLDFGGESRRAPVTVAGNLGEPVARRETAAPGSATGPGVRTSKPTSYRCLCGEFHVFEQGRCLVCLDRARPDLMCTRCRKFKGAVYQKGWLCARCAGLVS